MWAERSNSPARETYWDRVLYDVAASWHEDANVRVLRRMDGRLDRWYTVEAENRRRTPSSDASPPENRCAIATATPLETAFAPTGRPHRGAAGHL